MNSPNDQFSERVVAALPLLLRYAISLCRDPVRADDLVQDAALKALMHRETFTPGTNFNAWLFTILKNSFFSQRRKKQESEDPDDVAAKAVPFDDSPLRKMEVRELLILIDKMPETFRRPLRMLADGATYEEVADELHEHIGTIKSRVNRGREILKAAQ